MTDSEAELRREIEAKLAFWRKHELKDIYFPLEEIMAAIAHHDKTVEQAAQLFLLDKLIESEAVKEPVMIGQNALPFKVVTVATLNNERRRLLAALQTNQPGEEQK